MNQDELGNSGPSTTSDAAAPGPVREHLHRLNRELRAISNCNQTLMRAADEQALLDDICRIICDEAGYLLAWVGYAEDDEAKAIRPVAWAGLDAGYIAQARLTWADTERGRGPAGTAIRSGETIYLQDFAASPSFAPWLEGALRRGYRSGFALPLKDGDARTFGVLMIYSGEAHAITPEEIKLMEELAGDLAFGIIALRTRIEGRRAEAALHEKEQHSQALLRLSRSLERAQTHGDILGAAREAVRTVIGYQNLWVYLLSEDKTCFKALMAHGPVSETVMSEEGTATLPIQGDRMLEAIAEADEIVLVEDARTDDRVNHEITDRMGNRTLVNIPIILSDRRLGTVGVGTFGDEGVRVPTKSEQEFLMALASHMGVALDRIRLLEQRRLNEVALGRLNRELRAISNCNQILMRAVNEQTLLSDICHIVCDEAGYRMAWVGYVEQDEAKSLRPVAWAGLEEGYLQQARITWADTERGRGPSGIAIRTGESACIQDFATDPKGAPWRESALARGYRSSISLPLKGEGATPFGVLTIYSTEMNAFTPEEVRLLEELAGDLAFGIATLRTRADHEWMEQSLARREQEFRTLAENAPDVIVRYDRECRRLYVNPAFERVNHLGSEEVLGTRPAEKATELAPTAAFFTQQLKEVMESGKAAQIDLQWIKEGKENCWFVRAIPEFDAKGDVVSALTIWTDITQRKHLENALRESEQKFRSLAENSPENIFRYDRQGRIIYANQQVKMTLLSNDDSFLGMTPLGRSPEGLYEGGLAEMENYQATLQRVIATGEMADVEMHVPDLSGALRTHSVRFTAERGPDGQIVGALAFGRDVTEKARLEEQLRQSQKMEAIGQLAGGVAHDFNNILTAIIGFANLAKMKMPTEDPQQPLIDHILASADRAATLTRSLLAFSRKQVLIPKPVDLNAIVRNIENLLVRLIGEDIEFTTRLAGHSLITMADAGQIEQVLMNLATNARDAMPGGGALTIATEARTLGSDFTKAHGYGEPGRYAVITVSDTGIGMDEPTRRKIFEPFFTTKERGKGTGLGLSMVYGIIRQHEGIINVYSEPGRGTAFRIFLPLVALELEETQAETDAPPSGGTETLLLAEDDPDVRVMTSTVLRDFGYHVLEAVDGKDALEQYAAGAKGIDLLILDVIMPKLSGKEAYDAIRAMRPQAKVLFISGYTADALHQKGVFEEGIHFAAKPISPHALLKKIRTILDEPG